MGGRVDSFVDKAAWPAARAVEDGDNEDRRLEYFVDHDMRCSGDNKLAGALGASWTPLSGEGQQPFGCAEEQGYLPIRCSRVVVGDVGADFREVA